MSHTYKQSLWLTSRRTQRIPRAAGHRKVGTEINADCHGALQDFVDVGTRDNRSRDDSAGRLLTRLVPIATMAPEIRGALDGWLASSSSHLADQAQAVLTDAY